MINGLFLDSRTWKTDFIPSPFWTPEKYGIKIDLHPDPINIPNKGIDKKYKFVISTEVWEIPVRKSLEYMRSQGLKVFLIAREPFKTKLHKTGMFEYDKFLHNGEYYFTPDAVMAVGSKYEELWKGRAKTYITGYPRFDYYVDNSKWLDRNHISQKYNLSKDKKMIFFPSFTPYYYQKIDGKDSLVDLYDIRKEILEALEYFAKHNSDYQVVAKIHPMSFKCFKKGHGNGKEVDGLLKKYYNDPADHMVVIGDIRNSGLISKELITRSDIVVAFTSTMLLEAMLADKLAVHLLFKDSHKMSGLPEYATNITTVFNRNELYDVLLNTNKIQNNKQKILDDYLYRVDGKACERICKYIKDELG